MPATGNSLRGRFALLHHTRPRQYVRRAGMGRDLEGRRASVTGERGTKSSAHRRCGFGRMDGPYLVRVGHRGSGSDRRLSDDRPCGVLDRRGRGCSDRSRTFSPDEPVRAVRTDWLWTSKTADLYRSHADHPFIKCGHQTSNTGHYDFGLHLAGHNFGWTPDPAPAGAGAARS